MLAITAILGLSGCSTDWTSYSKAPVVTKSDEITRPIDHYMPDADTILAAVHRKQASVNKCLRDAGLSETFAYPDDSSIRAFVEIGIEDRIQRGDVWGFFSPDTVTKQGYQHSKEPPALRVQPLTSAGQSACGSLLPGEHDPILLFSYKALPEGGPKTVMGDPTVQEALGGWSACMSASGFDFSNPTDPLQMYASEQSPSTRQLLTARTDLRCKQETNLIALVLERQAAVDNAYIRKYSAELDNWTVKAVP